MQSLLSRACDSGWFRLIALGILADFSRRFVKDGTRFRRLCWRSNGRIAVLYLRDFGMLIDCPDDCGLASHRGLRASSGACSTDDSASGSLPRREGTIRTATSRTSTP